MVLLFYVICFILYIYIYNHVKKEFPAFYRNEQDQYYVVRYEEIANLRRKEVLGEFLSSFWFKFPTKNLCYF